MEEAIATTRRPWPENLGTLEKMERTLEEFPRGSRSWVLPRPEWLVKDSLRHVQGFAHARAMNRAAATAVMIERYRLAHAGALPDTLRALVPAYTAAVPRDPMTGAELLYRRSAHEYVIYSVGRNRRDDGGELVVTTRWSTKEGRDWGIRVRHLSARQR